VATSPPAAETTGIDAGRYSTDSATCRSSSTIGSISDEWNACETSNHDRFTPSSSDASSASSASRSPDSTTDRGPLTAASDTPSGSATSSSAACTASIAPPAGSALISRPRLSTSRAASSSENTPAMCAPASSPTE
jgi:hypothetical protein